ncbi:MAG: hypothetical protein KOO65_08580 [Desulfobacterales bacterium]|nr:hypothetical protein [Desulfobacterales bacterium]
MDLNKHIKGIIGADVSIDDRTATFIITSEILDEDKEVLLIDGMDLSAIKKGARDIVWLDHRSDQPSAKITGIEKVGNKVIASIKFPEKPEGIEIQEFYPDKAYALAKAGLLKASVDFMPVERRMPTKKDKSMFGDEAELVYSKTKLIGFSLTSMPANEEAQMLAVKTIEEEVNSKEIEIEPIVVEPEMQTKSEDIKREEIEKAEKVVAEISQKKAVKPYIITRRTDPNLVKAQIAKELAMEMAKKTGQIFID